MFKFDVYTTGFGRPLVKNGPMAGCYNFAKCIHSKINKRALFSYDAAKKLADKQDCLSMVMLNDPYTGGETGFCLYRNGKNPYTPDGWKADNFNYSLLLEDKDIAKFESSYSMPFKFGN